MDRLAAALTDRYRIVREIGAGGMATVYLAEDLKHNRQVALKVLRPELAATMGPERFFREIQVAARLQHPHILPLHDSGEADGFLFFVMPFVSGESLRERLDRLGELPVQDAVRILVEVADALSYSHSQGVVHRDIKPDNVMLSGRHALVTDFGVAKAVSEAASQNRVTTAGVALGTPAYMAPEQAAADPLLDHRVDIYALGVLGYELLAGRTPFTGMSPQQMLLAQVTQAPDPVSKYRDACPSELEAIIMRCLAKRASDRWQSADELLHALEPFAVSSGGITPTQSRPAGSVSGTAAATAAPSGASAPAAASRTPWLMGAALLVVFLAAVGGWLAFGRGGADRAAAVTLDRVQLTSTGRAFAPTLSPDGTRLAFAERVCDENGRCSIDIRVQDVEGAASTTLLRNAVGVGDIEWSGDGRFLLIDASMRERWGAFALSSLGGEPRFLGCCSSEFVASGDTAILPGIYTLGAPQPMRFVTIADGVVRDSFFVKDRQDYISWAGPGPTSGTVLAWTAWPGLPQKILLLERGGALLDSISLGDAAVSHQFVKTVAGGFVLAVSTDRDEEVELRRYRFRGSGGLDPRFTVIAGGVKAGSGLNLARNGMLTIADGAPQFAIWAIERRNVTDVRFTERRVEASTAEVLGSITAAGDQLLLIRTRASDQRLRDLAVVPFGGGAETSLGSQRDLLDWDFHQDGRSVLLINRLSTDSVRVSDLAIPSARVTPLFTTSSATQWFETVPGGGHVHIVFPDSIRVFGVRARGDTLLAGPPGLSSLDVLEPSPTGDALASVGWNATGDSLLLFRTSLATGTHVRLAAWYAEGIGEVTWTDGGDLLIAIRETQWSDVWYRIPPRGGTPQRLGYPPRAEASYRFARNGLRGVARERTVLSDIFLVREFRELLTP